MKINEFDYPLPEELIAQHPMEQREDSRLLVIHRKTGELEHRHFYDLLDYLEPGDCLVLNDSRVIPARLYGTKVGTGAKVEFLLIRRLEGDVWETMVRPGKRLHPGDRVSFSQKPRLEAEILAHGEDGTRHVKFHYDGIFMERLQELGKMPLPPYIQRENEGADRDRYQTVYCKTDGSVAAPTAGLHFTQELLAEARSRGIRIATVTLHVGIGTFRPVQCEEIEEHHMHLEEYEIDASQAELINETKQRGGRVVCVGTTSVRTLESSVGQNGLVKPGRGSTEIFIYPGYRFRVPDGLITNFHLPKSTLLMLVSAFYNREGIMEAYRAAVLEGYRFFSYGDAMLIL